MRTLTCLAAATLAAGGLVAMFVAPRARALDAFEGTVGSQFTVSFAGDLGKKPKVALEYVSEPTGKKPKTPKAKAKVTDVNGSQVTFQIQAAKGAGEFVVGLKGSDQTAGSLFLRAPRIDGAGSATAAAGGELTVNGRFFGTPDYKKSRPKVFVGGKKAKVTSLTAGGVVVRLSKKTPTGAADITVQTKVGSDTFAKGVIVTAAPKPIKGADSITAKIGGKSFKAVFTKKKPEAAVAVFAAPTHILQITAGKGSGKPTNLTTETFNIVVNIGVGSFDELALPATFTDVGLVTFTRTNVRSSGGIPPKITSSTTMWTNEASSAFTITIYEWDGERFSCSFGGTLDRTAGDGSATLDIASGSGVLGPRQ